MNVPGSAFRPLTSGQVALQMLGPDVAASPSGERYAPESALKTSTGELDDRIGYTEALARSRTPSPTSPAGAIFHDAAAKSDIGFAVDVETALRRFEAAGIDLKWGGTSDGAWNKEISSANIHQLSQQAQSRLILKSNMVVTEASEAEAFIVADFKRIIATHTDPAAVERATAFLNAYENGTLKVATARTLGSDQRSSYHMQIAPDGTVVGEGSRSGHGHDIGRADILSKHLTRQDDDTFTFKNGSKPATYVSTPNLAIMAWIEA